MMSKHNKTRIRILSCILASMCVVASAAYHVGDRGNDIKVIQKQLVKYGYRTSTNGVYSNSTASAVKKFQKSRKIAVDGVVGSVTYKALTGQAMPGGKNNAGKAETAKDLPIKGSASIQQLITVANSYRGVPYQFGGTTPSGFDCSGYTRFVFAKAGIMLPRAADEQYSVGKKVSRRNLQPGDLVFFETYASGVSHSGIYLGNDQFISATSSKGVAVARLSDSYWNSRYIGAKRIM